MKAFLAKFFRIDRDLARMLICTMVAYAIVHPFFPPLDLDMLFGQEVTQPAVQPTPIAPVVAQPALLPPSLKLEVTRKFDVGWHGLIEFKLSGGPIRDDFIFKWDQDIPPNSVVPHPECPNNPLKRLLSLPEGVYHLQVMVIGKEAGYSQAEAMIEVVNPNATIAPEPAQSQPSKDPLETFRDFVQRIPSPSLQADALAVGKAAHKTANEVRGGKYQSRGAMLARWKVNAILEMGDPSKLVAWERSAKGPAVFDFLNDVFADVQPADFAATLDSFGSALEGK